VTDQQPQPSLRDHIDHGVWKQVGRCVYCYCGAQLYQGQLAVTLAEKEQVVTALEQMIAQATAQQQAPPEPEDPAFVPLPAPERLLARFRLYLQSRGIREQADAQEGRLKEEIFNEILAAEPTAYTVDEKGSRTVMLPEPVERPPDPKTGKPRKPITGFTRQRRVSATVQPEVVNRILADAGIPTEEVYTTTHVPAHDEIELDEGKLYALNFAGRLSDEQLKACFTYREIYAMVLEDQ